jgi:hypothetical protein
MQRLIVFFALALSLWVLEYRYWDQWNWRAIAFFHTYEDCESARRYYLSTLDWDLRTQIVLRCKQIR